MTITNCELLLSKLRASWIEWLYNDDPSVRSTLEKEIILLQYKIIRNCDNFTDDVQKISNELKKLPIPRWFESEL
jgi:hypothetical protein